jgi:hypothetical protein
MRPQTISIVLACVLAGCGDQGRTDELITAGTAAGNELHTYYTNLTTINTEWWEYQTAFNALQEIVTSKELEKSYEERLGALRSRAAMAARLTDVYAAVGTLRDSKTSEPAIASAQNLGKTISAVPALPGIDLAGGLSQAADLLTGIARSRDFQEANTALTTALAGMRDLFRDEQAAYVRMVNDRDRTRHALIKSLDQRKLINTSPLLERLQLGIPWINASDNPVTRNLALTVDDVASKRNTTAWTCATSETYAVLSLLAAAHQGLRNVETPSPSGLQRASERAEACLAPATARTTK